MAGSSVVFWVEGAEELECMLWDVGVVGVAQAAPRIWLLPGCNTLGGIQSGCTLWGRVGATCWLSVQTTFHQVNLILLQVTLEMARNLPIGDSSKLILPFPVFPRYFTCLVPLLQHCANVFCLYLCWNVLGIIFSTPRSSFISCSTLTTSKTTIPENTPSSSFLHPVFCGLCDTPTDSGYCVCHPQCVTHWRKGNEHHLARIPDDSTGTGYSKVLSNLWKKGRLNSSRL